MVGVPGRSKGCKTCRTRKIRCSQERPQCSQCIKAGRTCLGYDRETIFISSSSGASGSYSKLGDQRSGSSSSSSQSSRRTSPHVTSPVCDAPSLGNTPGDLYVALTIPLRNASMRGQLLASYISCYQHASTGVLSASRSWINSIPELTTRSRVLETAAYALSTGKFGRELNDKDLARQSLSLYTRGLNQLQKALWDPNAMYSDETLAACMLLCIYEIVECPAEARTGYLSHFDGCSRLIQLRGAKRHVSGLGHSVFVQYRIMGALESLLHKPTFLLGQEWHDTPFLEQPKTALDKLVDLILRAPNLLRKGRALASFPPEQMLRGHIDLLMSCCELNQDMENFYNELDASVTDGPMYWKVPSTLRVDTGRSEADNLFPERFEFVNVPLSTVLILYFASRTVLWSVSGHLYYGTMAIAVSSAGGPLRPSADGKGLSGTYPPLLGQDKAEEFTLPYPIPFGNYLSMAHNVCMSVEYQFGDDVQARLLMAPLNMVLDSLRPYQKHVAEMAWVTTILKMIEPQVKMVRYLPRGS